MGTRIIKMPDVGEGVAEAEIVEWHVRVGDTISEDDVLAEVMTDKATVELPSPVDGVVRWLGAGVGEIMAVGADLVKIDTVTIGTGGDGPAPAVAAGSEPTDGEPAMMTSSSPAIRLRQAKAQPCLSPPM